MTHKHAHHAGTTPPDGSAQRLTPSQCDTSYAAATRSDIGRPQPAFQALAEPSGAAYSTSGVAPGNTS